MKVGDPPYCALHPFLPSGSESRNPLLFLATPCGAFRVLSLNEMFLSKSQAQQKKQPTSSFFSFVASTFNCLSSSSLTFFNLFLVSGLSALPSLVPTKLTNWKRDVTNSLVSWTCEPEGTESLTMMGFSRSSWSSGSDGRSAGRPVIEREMKYGRILGLLRTLISEKFPYSFKMFSNISASSG